MIDPHLGLGIVFNGCIYNYRDLRNELKTKGYRFFSEGDTEVILKGIPCLGTSLCGTLQRHVCVRALGA